MGEGKGGGAMGVRDGVKGEWLRGCWQAVRGPAGVLTFHSRRMMSPRSSSPAPTATSTSHSSISVGSSSTSSESMSTENWRGERGSALCTPLGPMLLLPGPAGSLTRLFDLLPVGGAQGLEKAPERSRFSPDLVSPKEQPQIWGAA